MLILGREGEERGGGERTLQLTSSLEAQQRLGCRMAVEWKGVSSSGGGSAASSALVHSTGSIFPA